jgi:hypothetical protein
VDTATGLSRGADLIQQLVINGTHHNENPTLMESVRRQAAHRIIAAAATTTVTAVSKTDDEAEAVASAGCVGERALYNGICLSGGPCKGKLS